ncbi:MAG: tetratricopeptide repeat protein [Nitrospinota bacterium]|nr:tetratricopeptide repeat protein [Nitrospinota bacterium]
MAQQKKSFGWSSMGEVLAESIKSLPETSDLDLNRINLLWSLVVGDEIGCRTQVIRVSKSTLFVEVIGKEWVSVLHTYERKILAKLNKIIDSKGFKEIIVKQVEGISTKSNKPLKISASPSHKPTMDKQTVDREEHLKPIADPELRERLARLSTKLRFVALAWVSAFILANCASPQHATHSNTIELDSGDQMPSMTLGSSKTSYAVRQVQALNKKYPDRNYRDPRAYYHYLKAYQFEREGDFDEATRHYALVVQFDPSRESLHTHLVSLYLRTGQFQQALEAGKDALSRFPNNVRVHMIMGDILSSQGKYQEASDHYKKVMEVEPSNARAYLLAGYNLRALKQYEDARELFHQATVVEPANPLGYHYLGSALVRTGEMQNAEEKFKKSLTLRPSFIEARENLARVLELQKKYSEAMEQYKIILKLKPGDKKINEHLKRFDFAAGAQSADNIEVADVPPFEPGEANIHTQIGIIFYEQAVYLEAVDEFRLALANEEDKELRLVIAKIYELFGRMDKAIKEVEAYRKDGAGEESIDILLNLARLYGLNKEMRKSIDLLKKAVAMDPANDRYYHALALAHMSLNENEEAYRNINKAIELNDKKDTYYFEQGALLERLGQFDKAIVSMKQTLEINPHHSNAHNFIGYIYATKGEDLDKALHHLEQALNIQPRNGYFLDSLGWIYHKKGEPEQALLHIKKAMVYAQPDPVLYDHLGDVHFSMDNVTEARKAWKTSLALTLKKLEDPAGEIPDPDELRDKIRKADQLMLQSF